MSVVAFRTDASRSIGAGHAVRCLALADVLRQQGTECVFVMGSVFDDIRDVINERGHHIMMLPIGDTSQSAAVKPGKCNGPKQEDELGVGTDYIGRFDWEKDAECTAAALQPLRPDWLVVDHYCIDSRWEAVLRDVCGRVLVIDDLANRNHECDVLVDQTAQSLERYAGLVPDSCKRLLGPRYALLRPEFEEVRSETTNRTGQVRRILVFCGLGDVTDETSKAVRAIGSLDRADVEVSVVIAASNRSRHDLESLCRQFPNIKLICGVRDMARLMGDSDLFVGAGGTSAWERCCVGLPGIVWATADNQQFQGEFLSRIGAQFYLGTSEAVTPERLARIIDEMLRQPEMIVHMSEQARKVTDGRGAKRVANCMMVPVVKLRRATGEDCESIHVWRNHPAIRRYAVNPSEIVLEEHHEWFEGVLSDPSRVLLVAESKSNAVGVLRFDLAGHVAKVSLYVVPGKMGKGFGRAILRAGEEWLREHCPSVTMLEAEVCSENIPSLGLFQSEGYDTHRQIFRKVVNGNS